MPQISEKQTFDILQKMKPNVSDFYGLTPNHYNYAGQLAGNIFIFSHFDQAETQFLYLDAQSAYAAILKELMVKNLFHCNTRGYPLLYINNKLDNRMGWPDNGSHQSRP